MYILRAVTSHYFYKKRHPLKIYVYIYIYIEREREREREREQAQVKEITTLRKNNIFLKKKKRKSGTML